MRKDVQQLWNLIDPAVRAAGFDLVELDWGREPSGWVLRAYVDHPAAAFEPHVPGGPALSDVLPPRGVTFEDCERVSRDVSAALDVADVIPHAYRLEVSSPGLDRPLRREQDFRRFAGHTVKLRTFDAVDGRRNFLGTLLDARDGHVEVACEGRPYRVPVESVARANLVPDWGAEFKKAERSAS
jgi:ribosome maturation factor RimP